MPKTQGRHNMRKKGKRRRYVGSRKEHQFLWVVTVCGIGHTLPMGIDSFRSRWMNPRSWRDAPKWGASFLAWHSCQVKPSEWVCGESLCEVKIACCCNKILSSFPITYTLGFSRCGEWDNLTHCVHLKRNLDLLLGFDSLPSLWRCVVYVCLCYVLVLFVSGGWYLSCSDTRSLFTQHGVV